MKQKQKKVLTGTSSHRSTFPIFTQRLQGRATSHARCARLHGPHALDTFALPPTRLITGGVGAVVAAGVVAVGAADDAFNSGPAADPFPDGPADIGGGGCGPLCDAAKLWDCERGGERGG